MAMMQCTDLRIGASSATLTLLRNRGIPDPDTFTYRPYTVRRTAGTGAPKSYGKPTTSWSWDALDQNSIYVLLAFLDAVTDASAQVYISTYTDYERRRTVSDFTAYMHRPIDGDGKEMFPGSIGQVSQSVTLSFTGLEAA